MKTIQELVPLIQEWQKKEKSMNTDPFPAAFTYCDAHGITVVGQAVPNAINKVKIIINNNGKITESLPNTYTNQTVSEKIKEIYITLYQRAQKL